MKFKTYKGEALNDYTLSIKLDGIQSTHTPQGWISKTGKRLYNLPTDVPYGVYEYFRADWNSSMSDVRTQDLGYVLDKQNLYSLEPLDARLLIGSTDITAAFNTVVSSGGEGIIIRTGKVLYKMKKLDTFDVEVTGWIEGTGKYTDKMGALITTHGKVGTGFTDADRQAINRDIIGSIIEVECMELTAQGKFRMPRFVRIRYDK